MTTWQKQVFPEPFFRPAPARLDMSPITAAGLLSRAVGSFVRHTPFLLGVSLLMFSLITLGSCACYVPGLIVGTLSSWAVAAWSLGTVDGHARLRDGRIAIDRPLHAAIGSVWFGVMQALPAAALAAPVLFSLAAAIPLWEAPELALVVYALGWPVGLVLSGAAMARVGAARFLAVEHDVNPIEASREILIATGAVWRPLSLAYGLVSASILLAVPWVWGVYLAAQGLEPGSLLRLTVITVGTTVFTLFGLLWFGVLTNLDAVTYRALGYPEAAPRDAS